MIKQPATKISTRTMQLKNRMTLRRVTEKHYLQEIIVKEKINKKSAYDTKLETNPQELIICIRLYSTQISVTES